MTHIGCTDGYYNSSYLNLIFLFFIILCYFLYIDTRVENIWHVLSSVLCSDNVHLLLKTYLSPRQFRIINMIWHWFKTPTDNDYLWFISWVYFACSMLKPLKKIEDEFTIYCNWKSLKNMSGKYQITPPFPIHLGLLLRRRIVELINNRMNYLTRSVVSSSMTKTAFYTMHYWKRYWRKCTEYKTYGFCCLKALFT